MDYTLTTEQLSDIIDKAFSLGKRYATDELNTLPAGTFAKTRTPIYLDGNNTANDWTLFLDTSGGHGLHSGDAKADILFEALKDQIRIRFHQTVDFD